MATRRRGGTRSLRRLRGWTLALIAAMSLGLAAVLWIQTRQLSAMQSSLGFRSDYTIWGFFQMEVEALRLRSLLLARVAAPTALPALPALPVDDSRLRQAFEIFASRITLLRPERAIEGLPVLPGQRETVAELDAFVARFDPWLSEAALQAPEAAVVRDALARLDSLAPRLRELAVGIQHAYGELAARRAGDVERQSQLMLVLAAVLAAMLTSFALLLLAHLRALAARQQRLVVTLRRLRLAQREARQASEAKTRFLANMSHEIRTPLQGVLGQLSLLAVEALPPEQSQHLQVAQESAQQLLAVLNDVIDATRLESGRLRLVPAPCRPREVAAQVVELFRPVAASRGLQLRLTTDGEVPLVLMLDVVRLRQMLMNLVSNAVKFTDRGGVTLELSAAAVDDAGAVELVFAVEDTGIGIDEHTLAMLFQRFNQADSTLQRRHGGSGLGLEISRGLARLMGGDIMVTSRPGVGSRFTLRLPAVVPAAESALQAPADKAAHSPPAPVLRALRVLVADDNPVNRRFLGHALAALGHTACFADSGAAALSQVESQVFDLVLMDVHMPVMDGLQATQAIRALGPGRGSIPIVALTADVMPETSERAAAAGASAVLHKPVRKDDISALLSGLFSQPEATA